MTHTADLVREVRSRSKLSLRALAERAGTSSATLSNYELGKKEPHLSTLERIALAAGTSLQVRVVPDLEPALRGRASAAAASLEVARAVDRGEDDVAFRRCLELLDDLRSVPAAGITALASNPPIPTGDRRYDALIAALVEDCCVRGGVPTPPWVYEPERSVDGWYVAGLSCLRAQADQETPPVFRRHGVLILADEFTRA
ncbi:MAG: helix-turn-helix transcriptional regulator [Actinomycetota bacterium]|nr:helix-turn-helix transcriptional regulator [Actinomycetota bacterium]